MKLSFVTSVLSWFYRLSEDHNIQELFNNTLERK